VQKGHLTRHLVHRENEKSKPIECEYCCRRFSSQRAANKHRQIHVPTIEHPIKVHVSGKTLAEITNVDVRDSGNVIVSKNMKDVDVRDSGNVTVSKTKNAHVGLKCSTLIVQNVGG